MGEQKLVKTFVKTRAKASWESGLLGKMKKEMQTPVAQGVVKGVAVAAAAGVAAAGIAGALATRQTPAPPAVPKGRSGDGLSLPANIPGNATLPPLIHSSTTVAAAGSNL